MTQQRILTGEEKQHKGCMTIIIISAKRAFLPAGVVQGTKGACAVLPTRSGLSPPALPLIPGELAPFQPPVPRDPAKQRLTNVRVDSGGIFQGGKNGLPFLLLRMRNQFSLRFLRCRVHFRGDGLLQKCTHIYTHTYALFGCSFFLFPLL